MMHVLANNQWLGCPVDTFHLGLPQETYVTTYPPSTTDTASTDTCALPLPGYRIGIPRAERSLEGHSGLRRNDGGSRLGP